MFFFIRYLTPSPMLGAKYITVCLTMISLCKQVKFACVVVALAFRYQIASSPFLFVVSTARLHLISNAHSGACNCVLNRSRTQPPAGCRIARVARVRCRVTATSRQAIWKFGALPDVSLQTALKLFVEDFACSLAICILS